MPITKSLTDITKAELEIWASQQLIECARNPSTGKPLTGTGSQAGSDMVAKYWREGLGDQQRNGCSNVAWSAAFVCWSLRQAGVKLDEFPFSAGHHTYIRWAINNSKQDKLGKLYYGMRVATYRPQPGDMIAQWRKAKDSEPDPSISFDVQPDDFYASHCDIVSRATPDKIFAVGGNVSNRVKGSSFGAIDGLLKPKKALICVLRLAIDMDA
jgi:hypothetical protein